MNNRKSIYILTAITPLDDRSDNIGKYDLTEDNDINVYRERIGIFDNVEYAEEVIQSLIKNNDALNKRWNAWVRYCCFILEELYINDALYGEGNYSSFESVRSYDCEGKLLCFSDYDERCEKKFVGRDEQIKNVKEEDFALCLCGNKLVPIYIEKLALTKTEWNERFKNSGATGDFTDDSGLAFCVSMGHEHPFSSHIIPMYCLPYYKVTDDLKTKIFKEKDNYYNGTF